MKKLNKIIALLLGTSMLFGISACNKKESDTAGVKTLTWLVPGDTPEDLPMVLEKVNEITVEKIGAKVDLQFIDAGAYKEKLNTYMATSKKYDLAVAGYCNPLNNAADKGGIMALDELLETVPELKESLPDFVWDLAKHNGKIYAVPNYQVLPAAYGVNFFKEYLDDIGDFNPYSVHTLDDCEPYFEKAKAYFEEKGMQNAYALSPLRTKLMPLTLDYCKDYSAYGDVLFKQNENGEWKGQIMWEVPEYRQAVEKIREWYEKGYIRPDIVSSEGDTHGKAAVTMAVWKPGIEEIYATQGNDLYCQPIQTPVIDESKVFTVIGKDCKDPELAIKLISLVNTDKELYNLITLGIEGVHYEKTGENTFKYIGDSKTNKYFVNAGWKFGNQFNEYVVDGSDEDVWEQTKAYNESAKISPFAGFSAETKPIRTELSQIETVASKYAFAYVGAQNPADYYDTFISEIKAAGSDKVVAEYERQIAEFLANKN